MLDNKNKNKTNTQNISASFVDVRRTLSVLV